MKKRATATAAKTNVVRAMSDATDGGPYCVFKLV